MLLTLNERTRHLEAPPADEGEECIFKQLHAALEKLLLAPAEHTGHVEIGFEDASSTRRAWTKSAALTWVCIWDVG